MLTTAAETAVGSARPAPPSAVVRPIAATSAPGAAERDPAGTTRGRTVRRRALGWRLAAVVAGLALALGLAACGDDDDDGDAAGDTAGGAAEVTLNLGYVTTPEHPYGIALDQYVENVRTASGGAIELTTIPSYAGGSDVQLLQDVRDGAVEMASVSSVVWGGQGVTAFDALQALGLINRYDLEGEVIGGPIGQEMLKATEEIGLKGLAIHEGGLRTPLGATEALTGPADFEGKKIRTPEGAVLETGIRALGADPVALPLGDVYSGLREGVVDGMEANLGLIVTQKFYEVAKFITPNLRLWPFPTVLAMNQASFDALTAEQQQILVDEAAKLPALSLEIFTQPSTFPQTICDNDGRFVIASDADLAAFGRASEAAIAELSRDAATKGFIDQIQAIKDGLPPPAAPPPLPEGCTVTQ
jgi:TRAP-type transport system periplasmic protein